MALFGAGRRNTQGREAVPGPGIVEPRRSLDGWTLEGTPLDGRFGREDLRELATLLHGVGARMHTAWTYERAADLLERGGERPQALAVLDVWFDLPEDVRKANAAATRGLGRRRQRLLGRLGGRPGETSPDAPAGPPEEDAGGAAPGVADAVIPGQAGPEPSSGPGGAASPAGAVPRGRGN